MGTAVCLHRVNGAISTNFEFTWTLAHLPPPKANESISPLMKNMLSPVHLYTCHTHTHNREDKQKLHLMLT